MNLHNTERENMQIIKEIPIIKQKQISKFYRQNNKQTRTKIANLKAHYMGNIGRKKQPNETKQNTTHAR